MQKTPIEVLDFDPSSLAMWQSGSRRELRLLLNTHPSPRWSELFAQEVIRLQFVIDQTMRELSPSVRGGSIVCIIADGVDAQAIRARLRQLVECVEAQYRADG